MARRPLPPAPPPPPDVGELHMDAQGRRAVIFALDGYRKASVKLGIPIQTLNDIVHGKASVSATTKRRFRTAVTNLPEADQVTIERGHAMLRDLSPAQMDRLASSNKEGKGRYSAEKFKASIEESEQEPGVIPEEVVRVLVRSPKGRGRASAEQEAQEVTHLHAQYLARERARLKALRATQKTERATARAAKAVEKKRLARNKAARARYAAKRAAAGKKVKRAKR